MKNKTTIAVIIIIILISGGIYMASNKNPEVASDGHTDHTHTATTTTEDHSAHMTEGQVLGAKLAGTRVVLTNTSLKTGNQTISFQLFGKDGHAFGSNDLSVTHEKKMHFIVVSDDFKEYLHLHPEFKDGLWTVNATLKGDTVYQAYVDISPTEETPQVLRVPLTVGTAQNRSKVTQNDSTFAVGPITASMKSGDLVAGHENDITFTLTKSGKAITPEMYLGALGHVVALNHSDADNFVHAHPVTHEGSDNDIHFAINFPTTGTYTFFAQFQVDGKVATYPFSVTVKEGHNEPNGHSTNTGGPAEAAHH